MYICCLAGVRLLPPLQERVEEVLRYLLEALKLVIGVQRSTVSFHNFKSQNFKLRVSNPKGKYVAYLSVLSQISSCQSLGRKTSMKI